MEKVQFQLESTLPELKDLHEKGLFSRHEIDQITRRRTQLETSLVRKGNRKEDFFKYAEYEISLEKLRRLRWKRLGYDKNPPPPSASLYSIPRRTMYILKRATAKFPGDIATWLAYVEYAGKEGMRKIVTKGLTSALQHHPLSSTLYLLSSFHHIYPGAPFPHSAIPSTSTLDLPSAAAAADADEDEPRGTFALEGTQAARTTLLLGLRLLPRNHELWREYIKLELAWVEALRRRWKVLGISNTSRPVVNPGEGADGGQGSFGPDGEDARKAILGGELVVQAIRSALQAIPINNTVDPGTTGYSGLDFRDSLLQTLRTYPSPLRSKCLEVVYDELALAAQKGGKAGARARMVSMTRRLYDRDYEPGRKDDGGVILEGEELIEELGRIGKDIRKEVKTAGQDFGEVVGIWLDERIRENQANADLSAYLLSVFGSLTKPALNPTPNLLLLHLGHLRNEPATKYRHTARAYAALHPSSLPLQLERLRSETATASKEPQEEVRAIAEGYIKAFDPSKLDTEGKRLMREIWDLWIKWELSTTRDPKVLEKSWSRILRLSLSASGTPEVHNDLLIRYFNWLVSTSHMEPFAALKRITATYRPASAVYAHILHHLVSADAPIPDVTRLHEMWRAVCTSATERVEEALSVAEVLLRRKKAKEAVQVMEVVRSEVKAKGAVLSALEVRWKALLDRIEAEQAEASEGDESSEGEEMEDDAEEDVGMYLDVGDGVGADVSMDEESN